MPLGGYRGAGGYRVAKFAGYVKQRQILTA